MFLQIWRIGDKGLRRATTRHSGKYSRQKVPVVSKESDKYRFLCRPSTAEIMRSSAGLSRLRPVDESIISAVLRSTIKNSIFQTLYLLLGIRAWSAM